MFGFGWRFGGRLLSDCLKESSIGLEGLSHVEVSIAAGCGKMLLLIRPFRKIVGSLLGQSCLRLALLPQIAWSLLLGLSTATLREKFIHDTML